MKDRNNFGTHLDKAVVKLKKEVKMKHQLLGRRLIIVFLTLSGLFSCASGNVVVVRKAPPAQRMIVVKPHKPHNAAIWVDGHWIWKKDRYVWVDGYWVKARRGYVYIPGRWVKRKNGWIWIEGHWRKL
jgi:hypothetical protein